MLHAYGPVTYRRWPYANVRVAEPSLRSRDRSQGKAVVTDAPVAADTRVVAARRRAALIRSETLRLIQIAGTGHYSSVFSCAEILATLYSGVMRLAEDPDWEQWDRLVLSKGHCAVGVYPLLAERGYLAGDVLDGYTRLGNPLGDHPDMRRVPGIDFSSGSLGHGLSIGAGMALAARLAKQQETGGRSPAPRPARIWVLLGDQELNEGQVWEAAQTASHFGLGNLCAIVDANQMGLDGMTREVMPVEPIAGRFAAFGWDAVEVAGHDIPALLDAFDALPPTDARPA
jgi:transketolase